MPWRLILRSDRLNVRPLEYLCSKHQNRLLVQSAGVRAGRCFRCVSDQSPSRRPSWRPPEEAEAAGGGTAGRRGRAWAKGFTAPAAGRDDYT